VNGVPLHIVYVLLAIDGLGDTVTVAVATSKQPPAVVHVVRYIVVTEGEAEMLFVVSDIAVQVAPSSVDFSHEYEAIVADSESVASSVTLAPSHVGLSSIVSFGALESVTIFVPSPFQTENEHSAKVE
jgi:hypothetical protein